MNSYIELGNKYLKSSRKKTILTVIGIILSVALITSIGTFILTVQNSYIQNSIKKTGNYHVVIKNISKDTLEKVKSNPKVESTGVFYSDEPVQLDSGKELYFNYLSKEAFELKNILLIEGNLPENDDEVVLERWVLKYVNGKVSVGDYIELPNKEGNIKTYKLVGITEGQYKSQVEGVGQCYFIENNNVTEGLSKVAYVKIKDKAKKSEVISELRLIIENNQTLEVNDDLLHYTGESSNSVINESLFKVVFIVISIVVIATIVVIYNAFHISIAERIKQFGLLRAIGTTKRQVINLVLREANIMILIGVPIGVFFGILSVYCIAFVFSKMATTVEFGNLQVIISPVVILISVIIGVITIYISAYLPARAAGKISPLVAISNQAVIKKEKRNRSGRILAPILKIDKLMAVKNVKRNKKRFYITVFSMALSVTLFITFMSFSRFSTNFTGSINEKSDVDFQLMISHLDENVKTISQEVIDEVEKIPNLDNVFRNFQSIKTVRAIVKDESIPTLVKEYYENNEDIRKIEQVQVDNESRKAVKVAISTYGDEKLKLTDKYIKEGSLSTIKDDEVIVVRNSKFMGDRTLVSPMVNLEVGDELLIDLTYGEEKSANITEKKYESDELKRVKVGAIVDESPFNDNENWDALNIIISENQLNNFIKEYDEKLKYEGIRSLDIRLKEDSYADEVDKALKDIETNSPGIEYYNVIKSNEEEKAFNMQIMILLMGFTVVVTLIGAVNIINTVTTTILLRKAEISALRAIGMSSRQVRKMISFEGILFGIYGWIIGSILGTLLSYAIYDPMNNIKSFAYIVPWKSIAIALGSVIILGYISALIPLNRLKHESIIEGIRGE